MIERMAEERAKLEEKQEIALKMLRNNLPLEQILRFTDLTIEQVQQLQSQADQN
jgi:predicted transposase/invertase (TIGR01784 family)